MSSQAEAEQALTDAVKQLPQEVLRKLYEASSAQHAANSTPIGTYREWLKYSEKEKVLLADKELNYVTMIMDAPAEQRAELLDIRAYHRKLAEHLTWPIANICIMEPSLPHELRQPTSILILQWVAAYRVAFPPKKRTYPNAKGGRGGGRGTKSGPWSQWTGKKQSQEQKQQSSSKTTTSTKGAKGTKGTKP
jgi:hypothetical protein